MESPSALPATGERTAPGLADEEYWFARHEAAYRWIAGHVPASSRVVVDAGAGEGYGADLLRGPTRTVIALEYDAATCAHARDAYADVVVIRANLAGLPLRTGTADVLACCQVIEHLWSLPAFLLDCRRVMSADGIAIFTTPNRPQFSPGLGRGERPLNPFHVEEFDAAQLGDLLGAAGFADVRVLGLHHGERLAAWESTHGSLVAAQVTAIVEDDWTSELRDMVGSVRAVDFEIRADVEGAHDLVAIARGGTP